MVETGFHGPIGAPIHLLPSRGILLLDFLRFARRMPRSLIAAALALAVALVFAPVPSRAAYMAPGSPVQPKDFTLVKRDGYYHLFYILNNLAVYPNQTQTSFGHAISSDLYHWTQLPPVLQVSSLDWDNLHVWAPCVVQQDGLWWMLYAGITLDATHNQTQRIGLAVSADLDTWTRVETPVWDATQVPWVWSNPASGAPAFRDPFVMPDPQSPGGWLMYYDASYGADSAATVVGVARSSGDLRSWSDAGPLLITWRGMTWNQVTESPHLIQHNGLWYLFITTNSGDALSIYTSTDPTGPSWMWNYRGRLRTVLGMDTSGWYASEGMQDGTHQLFAYVMGGQIELREMVFGSSWLFSLVPPPYFHVMSLAWASPALHEGDTTAFFMRIANPASGRLVLRTFVVDSLGAETPVAPESLGLGLPAFLSADTLSVPWVARRWPRVPATDTTTITRLRVRTDDSTAISAILSVRGRPIPSPPDSTPPGVGPGGDPELPLPYPEKHVFFRALHDTPLGATTALAVGLEASAPARVDIYDILGRRVRNLAQRDLPAGVTVLPWDGRDQSGVRLERGVYFARLVAGDHLLTVRLLLLDH